MRCEMDGCENPDQPTLVILPIPKPDGSLITIACEPCARKSNAYCLRHNDPHLGFEDGTTACRECIEEGVRERGRSMGDILIAASSHFPEKDWTSLFEWASCVAETIEQSVEECITRAVVTLAQRRGVTPFEIIQEVINQRKPDILLPSEFSETRER